MKNYGNYTWFYYVGTNPKFSFRNYVHPATGHETGYVVGFDKNNQPIYKEWYFDYESRRQIRVGNDEKDKNGLLAVDFLRNSPEFYGNPDGHYFDGKQVLFKFKEVNEDRDAKEAVASREVSIEAQARALKLKGQELIDIANIIGIFGAGESVMTHRVLDFASNTPKRFIELLDDPARKIKALIERALNDRVFVAEGKLIKWEGKVIGADKEEAVSNLMKDQKLLDAVELNLKKFGSK